MTPSAASSGWLEPTCCLGVLDASVCCDSNLVFAWEFCSEDIVVGICMFEGVVGVMLSAYTKQIGKDGTFPKRVSSLVISKHRTCVSFLLISGFWN